MFFAGVSDAELAGICLGAFLFHVVVHWTLLYFVVPRLCRREHFMSDATYGDAAAISPRTWFSVNPVHCLRSKHYFQHDPPCDFYARGKEHNMRANPEIGSFYDAGSFIDDGSMSMNPDESDEKPERGTIVSDTQKFKAGKSSVLSKQGRASQAARASVTQSREPAPILKSMLSSCESL